MWLKFNRHGPSPTMAHHADDRKACATFQEWTDRLRPPVLDSYLGDAELLKNESPDIATFREPDNNRLSRR